MKKTFRINLAGSIYTIDDDAYTMLDAYLVNLRKHFNSEDDANETMHDFEMRISELFSGRIRLGAEVITMEDVKMVIEQMGRPEDIFEEEEAAASKHHYTGQSAYQTASAPVKKKLFRNPDNKVLGGVCSGIAAYFGIDDSLVRIIFFILLWFYGVIFLIYMVLWLLIPEAKTATERLQMRGESVTVESIGKTVTESLNPPNNSDQSNSKPGKAMRVLGEILKIIAIGLAILFAPAILFLLFLLLVVSFVLIAGGWAVVESLFPWGIWDSLAAFPTLQVGGATLGALLMVGIPITLIIYWLIGQFVELKPLSKTLKRVILIAWLIGIILSIISGVHIINFKDMGHNVFFGINRLGQEIRYFFI